ncbi:MAG: hypothetical protein ACI4TU_06880 [Candidatus Cryptobacteroides sp.]
MEEEQEGDTDSAQRIHLMDEILPPGKLETAAQTVHGIHIYNDLIVRWRNPVGDGILNETGEYGMLRKKQFPATSTASS